MLFFSNRYPSSLFHLSNCPALVFVAGSVTTGRQVMSFLSAGRRELFYYNDAPYNDDDDDDDDVDDDDDDDDNDDTVDDVGDDDDSE